MFAKKSGKFVSDYSGEDTRIRDSVINDQGVFVKVPFSRERLPYKPELILKMRKERIFAENEKQNVYESLIHIMKFFPEAIAKLTKVDQDMDSYRKTVEYDVEMDGGLSTYDFEALKKNGIEVGFINATKDGHLKFSVQLPKNLVESSPKKENKVEFGMKNLGLPHIKQGMHIISSGNSNETEQEMLRMQFDSGLPKGKPLTDKQKKRITEIERMADPHEIGLAESPFKDRI